MTAHTPSYSVGSDGDVLYQADSRSMGHKRNEDEEHVVIEGYQGLSNLHTSEARCMSY